MPESMSPPAGLERVDAILVDDDLLTRLAWKVRAKQAGKNLEVCENEQQLTALISRVRLDTPIYIDVLLAEGVRGEEVAKRLYEKNYSQLFLTTGLDPETLVRPEFVQKILGKSPPW